MFTLTLETLPGTHIDEAKADALRIAEKIGVDVIFKFNDKTYWALTSGKILEFAPRKRK